MATDNQYLYSSVVSVNVFGIQNHATVVLNVYATHFVHNRSSFYIPFNVYSELDFCVRYIVNKNFHVLFTYDLLEVVSVHGILAKIKLGGIGQTDISSSVS